MVDERIPCGLGGDEDQVVLRSKNPRLLLQLANGGLQTCLPRRGQSHLYSPKYRGNSPFRERGASAENEYTNPPSKQTRRCDTRPASRRYRVRASVREVCALLSNKSQSSIKCLRLRKCLLAPAMRSVDYINKTSPIGRKIARIKSSTLILVTFNRFSPMARMSNDPTQVISATAASLSTGARN